MLDSERKLDGPKTDNGDVEATTLRATLTHPPAPRDHATSSLPAETARRPGAGTYCGFALTLLLSSTLLFLVQPMVGKMVLPLLGGTPAVWNTCMVFFQAVLLAGYLYSHLTSRWLGVRGQAIAHLAVLAAPLFVLPITIGAEAPPPGASPGTWLLVRLLATVGLPFFVLSTHAPLLQRWFAASGHPRAADPYFLYAASNVGSLLALASYPLWVERAFDLARQSGLWTTGYGVLAVLVVTCAAITWKAQQVRPQAAVAVSPASSGDRPAAGDLCRWTVLALVPSSLMLGVTTHVTTNLAAMPLLWVIPLGLYLLTFVLVFSSRPWLSHQWLSNWLPIALLPLAVLIFVDLGPAGWLTVPIHLGVFFWIAMVCHGELARRRPSADHLTGFYLCMSLGGVLGGTLNALPAPVLFRGLWEYPLMLAAAALLRPKSATGDDSPRQRRHDWLLPLGMAMAALTLIAFTRSLPQTTGGIIVFAVAASICSLFKDRPIRFGLGYTVLLLTVGTYHGLQGGRVLHAERNFFGMKRVELDRAGAYRMLVHGSTNHGVQSVDPARRSEPLSYYSRSGPLGDVFAAVKRSSPATPVAVIGLGTGATACYAAPGQRFTFYEIDPAIERIARDPRYFTYLSDCRGDWNVVVGDGRLTLAAAEDSAYGLIILDAFSSDSIPAHLLTREAVRLYLSKLRQGGLLAFHVSNRYLDLMPLLGNLAESEGLVACARTDLAPAAEKDSGKLPSQYVVMGRGPADLGRFSPDRWQRLAGRADVAVWTDQRSDLLSLIRRR